MEPVNEPFGNTAKLAAIKSRFEHAHLVMAKFGTDGEKSVAHDYIPDVGFLLRKLEYKDNVISTALELIEDREKILTIVRPLVEQKWQELIDTVLDSDKNVGVGEERT